MCFSCFVCSLPSSVVDRIYNGPEDADGTPHECARTRQAFHGGPAVPFWQTELCPCQVANTATRGALTCHPFCEREQTRNTIRLTMVGILGNPPHAYLGIWDRPFRTLWSKGRIRHKNVRRRVFRKRRPGQRQRNRDFRALGLRQSAVGSLERERRYNWPATSSFGCAMTISARGNPKNIVQVEDLYGDVEKFQGQWFALQKGYEWVTRPIRIPFRPFRFFVLQGEGTEQGHAKGESRAPSFFPGLPMDVAVMILELLDPQDLLKLEFVNKAIRKFTVISRICSVLEITMSSVDT
ncbi:hypothetical protein DFJ77DRAFT_474398 [Powellomyces hirtus]|nr:hypothetical protein DFJ77DRAFT_474398 [Powellomyces hirtus]